MNTSTNNHHDSYLLELNEFIEQEERLIRIYEAEIQLYNNNETTLNSLLHSPKDHDDSDNNTNTNNKKNNTTNNTECYDTITKNVGDQQQKQQIIHDDDQNEKWDHDDDDQLLWTWLNDGIDTDHDATTTSLLTTNDDDDNNKRRMMDSLSLQAQLRHFQFTSVQRTHPMTTTTTTTKTEECDQQQQQSSNKNLSNNQKDLQDKSVCNGSSDNSSTGDDNGNMISEYLFHGYFLANPIVHATIRMEFMTQQQKNHSNPKSQSSNIKQQQQQQQQQNSVRLLYPKILNIHCELHSSSLSIPSSSSCPSPSSLAFTQQQLPTSDEVLSSSMKNDNSTDNEITKKDTKKDVESTNQQQHDNNNNWFRYIQEQAFKTITKFENQAIDPIMTKNEEETTTTTRNKRTNKYTTTTTTTTTITNLSVWMNTIDRYLQFEKQQEILLRNIELLFNTTDTTPGDNQKESGDHKEVNNKNNIDMNKNMNNTSRNGSSNHHHQKLRIQRNRFDGNVILRIQFNTLQTLELVWGWKWYEMKDGLRLLLSSQQQQQQQHQQHHHSSIQWCQSDLDSLIMACHNDCSLAIQAIIKTILHEQEYEEPKDEKDSISGGGGGTSHHQQQYDDDSKTNSWKQSNRKIRNGIRSSRNSHRKRKRHQSRHHLLQQENQHYQQPMDLVLETNDADGEDNDVDDSSTSSSGSSSDDDDDDENATTPLSNHLLTTTMKKQRRLHDPLLLDTKTTKSSHHRGYTAGDNNDDHNMKHLGYNGNNPDNHHSPSSDSSGTTSDSPTQQHCWSPTSGRRRSPYEVLRLERIARNEERLELLGLGKQPNHKKKNYYHRRGSNGGGKKSPSQLHVDGLKQYNKNRIQQGKTLMKQQQQQKLSTMDSIPLPTTMKRQRLSSSPMLFDTTTLRSCPRLGEGGSSGSSIDKQPEQCNDIDSKEKKNDGIVPPQGHAILLDSPTHLDHYMNGVSALSIPLHQDDDDDNNKEDTNIVMLKDDGFMTGSVASPRQDVGGGEQQQQQRRKRRRYLQPGTINPKNIPFYDKRKKRYRRPRGQCPEGYEWDEKRGCWVLQQKSIISSLLTSPPPPTTTTTDHKMNDIHPQS